MKVEEYAIPKVVSVKQAAAEFGIAENALRVWIKSGQLPAINCGRKRLINCSVLSNFLSNGLKNSKNISMSENSTVESNTTGLNSGYISEKSGRRRIYKLMPPII